MANKTIAFERLKIKGNLSKILTKNTNIFRLNEATILAGCRCTTITALKKHLKKHFQIYLKDL